MASENLGRHEPRAMAYAAAVQFGFGALQCLVGLTLWPNIEPGMRPVLVGGLMATILGAAVHALFAGRMPWWAPYLGGCMGVATILFMADRAWGQVVSALLVAQLVLIVLTVAIFFSRRPVAVHVGLTIGGWGLVCTRHEGPGVAFASWLTVGPSLIVTALIARWLVGRLLTLAERDALTGAASRATWNRMAAEPTHGPLCVAVIDLDHFKLVNDQHGHAAGDELLRQVVLAWKRALRSGDLLLRMGGDEFIVLLSGGDLESGCAVSERLRQRVEPFTSVTIGVAALQPGETLEAVRGRADRALYEAKRAGRGRVAVAPAHAATAR